MGPDHVAGNTFANIFNLAVLVPNSFLAQVGYNFLVLIGPRCCDPYIPHSKQICENAQKPLGPIPLVCLREINLVLEHTFCDQANVLFQTRFW